jgi:hypothetical protein
MSVPAAVPPDGSRRDLPAAGTLAAAGLPERAGERIAQEEGAPAGGAVMSEHFASGPEARPRERVPVAAGRGAARGGAA